MPENFEELDFPDTQLDVGDVLADSLKELKRLTNRLTHAEGILKLLTLDSNLSDFKSRQRDAFGYFDKYVI